MTQKNSMTGRVCVVTGATRGIGRATAEGLARLDATVVLVCRRVEDGQRVSREIAGAAGRQPDVVPADLSLQASLRHAAEELRQRYPAIHVLINNAGIITRKREVTVDGIEKQFAVNHLAYFLLTRLLLDCLRAGVPSRVINVSSGVHGGATLDFEDLQGERSYRANRAYGQSKLANILFTYELARRLNGTGITVNCLHPGVIGTRLLADYMGAPVGAGAVARTFGATPERGAATSIYLASSPEVEGMTGQYFEDQRPRRSSRESYDEAAARRLWEISERLTGLSS
jgi:NAD(P)-dependent dehydrogenase (short-subunit alcohol dehydrogenase family)